MSDSRQNNLSDASRKEILRRCQSEDFDGHTNFVSLSAEQRLDWLDEAARFMTEFKGMARPSPLPKSSASALPNRG